MKKFLTVLAMAAFLAAVPSMSFAHEGGHDKKDKACEKEGECCKGKKEGDKKEGCDKGGKACDKKAEEKKD